MLSILDLHDLIPDDDAGVAWLEGVRWPDGRTCPRCDSTDTYETVSPMPYRCRPCARYFSVRTGTLMENSRLPVRKWVLALYLVVTHPKGVSSVQLGKDIGVCQKTAWFVLARIRKAWEEEGDSLLDGVVEVDETFVGGKNRNRHRHKRVKGRGTAGKIPVVGARQRGGRIAAQVIANTRQTTLERFVDGAIRDGSTVYTDDARAYSQLHTRYRHDTVRHSIGEYVRGDCYTNSIESTWAVFKRTYHGTHHWMSAKHLHRYVAELVGRHNTRHLPVLGRMATIVEGMEGRSLTWAELVRA